MLQTFLHVVVQLAVISDIVNVVNNQVNLITQGS